MGPIEWAPVPAAVRKGTDGQLYCNLHGKGPSRVELKYDLVSPDRVSQETVKISQDHEGKEKRRLVFNGEYFMFQDRQRNWDDHTGPIHCGPTGRPFVILERVSARVAKWFEFRFHVR